MISFTKKRFILKSPLAWLAILLLLAVMSLAYLKFLPHSAALSMSDFRAGKIINDGLFYDNNSMSEADIQNWLNARLTCDTNGAKTSEYGGGTDYNGDGRVSRAEWAQSVHGYTGKFVCLTNYYENPNTFENNLVTGVTPAGAISGAAIIKRAADAYHVSPKVLLVKLRKESPGPLTADEWPWAAQFDAAIGYACPDPPAGQPVVCDPSYKGFHRQITVGAWQIDRYKVNYQNFRYKPFQTNYIQYNPDANCGGTNVYIENFATAGLYNYTPYQPNPGALANYPGTAPCGAYGNRNFWAFYNEWFGSTLGISRDASINSVTNTDGWLEYGQSRTVTVTVKNTGNDGWCADGSCPAGQAPTRLVAQNYAGYGAYDNSDPAWINSAQVKMQTPTVRPGEIGTFVFKVKAPYINGFAASSRFYVNIGGVGITSFAEDANLWLGTHAYAPPSPTLVSQTQQAPTTLLANQEMAATVTVRNNSQTTWYSDNNLAGGRKPFRLYVPGYAASPFYNKKDARWLTPSQIAMTTPIVNPGETAVFEFTLLGAFKGVSSPLKLVPVIDGVSALQDIGIKMNITTPEPTLSYEFVSASFPPSQTTVGTNSSQKATISLKNTSNTIWHNDSSGFSNPTRIVTIFPIYRASSFHSSTDSTNWLAPSQIAMKTPVVNPGETAVFEFEWKAPSQTGNYLEYFSLVTDGYKFFPMYGSAWRTIVTN